MESKSSRRWHHGLIVFLIALSIGLAINVGWGARDLTGDEADYLQLANHLLRTGHFGMPGALAYRAPLYPMVLAAALNLPGDPILIARGLNSLLAALMVAGAAAVAGRLSYRVWPIYLAAVLMMLQSYWWLHQVVLMQENLSAVLVVASLIAWPLPLAATEKNLRGQESWAFVSGLCFGFSQLAKPVLLPFFVLFPTLIGLAVLQNRHWRKLGYVGLFLLAATLTILPWTLRNQIHFHQLVPLTTGSGEVFWGAHAPDTIRDFPGTWQSTPLPWEFRQQLPEQPASVRELAASRLRWQAGWESIQRAETWDLFRHFALKVAKLWSPSTFFASDSSWPGVKPVLIGVNALVLLLAAGGIAGSGSDRPMILGWIISLSLTCFVFWGSIRFQYVLSPVLAGMAASGVVILVSNWRQNETSGRAESRNVGSSAQQAKILGQ